MECRIIFGILHLFGEFGKNKNVKKLRRTLKNRCMKILEKWYLKKI